ncbi:site-specific integrase [Algibacter sp.]|nr:site-specific integrase [Algibacter sp.]
MKESIKKSLYLDNRRKKSNGKYPIKLRLYQARTEKEKLFRTGFDYTEEEFKQGYQKKEPAPGKTKLSKKEGDNVFDTLTIVYANAQGIINELKEFSFESFEKRFYNKSSKLDVCDYYEDYVNILEKEGRIRTAESYLLSLNRLKHFLNRNRKTDLKTIPFDIITVDTLKDFEKYYSEKGLSITSIGIYLRPLRAIFNRAISDVNSDINIESYPFGKYKYSIPSGKNNKRALSKKQLKKLFESKPQTEQQEKAKAFWFFSYLANGMNIKDIAELKFSDLKENEIEFLRSKTKNTTKENKQKIKVILPQYSIDIINQYGNKEQLRKNYIFPIISNSDTPKKAIDKIKAFTRFINKHFKKLAINEGINEAITTYWARHSFSRQALNKGASMELLKESLGHKNINTTESYVSSFDTDTKEKLSKSLLDF